MSQPTESHQPLIEALLAGLAKEAGELRGGVFEATTNALTEMTEQQKKDREAFNKRNARVVNALLVIAGVACLAVLLAAWGFWTVRDSTAQIRDGNDRLNHLAQTNRTNTTIIRSCTSPGGDCAKRAAAQQLVALEAIVFCDRSLTVGASAADVSRCISGALSDFQETP